MNITFIKIPKNSLIVIRVASKDMEFAQAFQKMLCYLPFSFSSVIVNKDVDCNLEIIVEGEHNGKQI